MNESLIRECALSSSVDHFESGFGTEIYFVVANAVYNNTSAFLIKQINKYGEIKEIERGGLPLGTFLSKVLREKGLQVAFPATRQWVASGRISYLLNTIKL